MKIGRGSRGGERKREREMSNGIRRLSLVPRPPTHSLGTRLKEILLCEEEEIDQDEERQPLSLSSFSLSLLSLSCILLLFHLSFLTHPSLNLLLISFHADSGDPQKVPDSGGSVQTFSGRSHAHSQPVPTFLCALYQTKRGQGGTCV